MSSKKEKILVVIPARGGSRGIAGKNIKPLNGKPLIFYSIDIARQLTSDENICVSSDAAEIIKTVETYGLKVPFIRPAQLATDEAGSNEVLLHAIDHYAKQNIFFDRLVLLQPTSPLRTYEQVKEAIDLYHPGLDMVVSVKQSHAAAVLCKEDNNGFLVSALNSHEARRQEMENYFEYNGAIYIINVKSLQEKGLAGFDKKLKYLMPGENSIDIDTPLDWQIAEMLLKNNLAL